ncbi:hypothetical protein FACS1894188_07140 [Clostridia bacterium]|nr:hypothetical protein FACS1894188_07140 [Clostridia bacterium]
MHDTMIQLTTERIISKDADELMTTFDFDESDFMCNVADWLYADTDRREDFEWFVKELKERLGDEAGNYISSFYSDEEVEGELPEAYVVIKPGFKRRFFEKQFAAFQEKIPKTLDEFVNARDLYGMDEIVGKQFSTYIIDEDKDYLTLDVYFKSAFIDDTKDTTLWLGTTLGYHW